MPVTLRLATPRDIGAIAELSRKTIEQGMPSNWHPARVAEALRDQNTNVVVAQLSGAVVGFGIMEYEDDTAHLLLFAVAPPDRRKGLGTQLLAWLEKVALAGGMTRIRLEARADNAPALAFYAKHGYRQSAQVLGMYHGAEDGVRLVKQL